MPAPCGTIAYSTTLNVVNGTPPFVWQITPAVTHWRIDADPTSPDNSRAVLAGNPAGPANLTIRVTDANGSRSTKRYSIVPRTACWFAYSDLEANDPKLALVDPLLGGPPAALAHNDGVYDFQFSPDGRFLAYRFGADTGSPKGKHVALVDLSTLNEQVLALGEDSVLAFAWSEDSSVLAVAFAKAQGTFLGGVRLSSGQTAALTPAAAYVDSDLFWIGPSVLVFHAPVRPDPLNPGQLLDDGSGEITVFDGQLGAAGFSVAPSSDSYFDPPVFIQPGDDGFFVDSLVTPPFIEFDSLATTAAAFHGQNVISPSGRYTAQVSDRQLQLFSAETGLPQPSAVGDQECPKLLTWASGRERIACVADVPAGNQLPAHGEVRIFDLASSSSLTASTVPGFCPSSPGATAAGSGCSSSEYDFTEEKSVQQPRIFSASGDWLAFTTSSPVLGGDNYLYWVDLRADFALKGKSLFSGATSATSSIKLTFSPNELFLVEQRDGVVWIHGTATSQVSWMTDRVALDGAETNPACSDDFASAPQRWCGSPNRTRSYLWSQDSKYIAYREAGIDAATSALMIVDISQFPELNTAQAFDAPVCDQNCAGQFAFQPTP